MARILHRFLVSKFVHDRKEMEEAKAKKGSTTVSSHASLNEHDAREMEEAAERRSRNEGDPDHNKREHEEALARRQLAAKAT